mmetsp:Transcript_21215/g.66643  ORF Transcript_21215/g.66643 Transcript_21215/m.66643 type:complete len:162 (-) Transcript_21215:28-513(-)
MNWLFDDGAQERACELEIIALLLDAGADPFFKTPHGSCFDLLIECSCDDPNCCEKLVTILRHGAVLNEETTTSACETLSADPTSSSRRLLTLIEAVREAGGTWRDYCLQPHKRVLALRSLVAAGRAVPEKHWTPPFLVNLLSPSLPNGVIWTVLQFWRETG